MNIIYYQTPAGIITIEMDSSGVASAVFVDAMPKKIDQKIDTKNISFKGTPFQCRVWRAAMCIPAGKTVTYQELAIAIGNPKAFRAVANALGQNKIAYFIPCHRVIRKNGALGGYKWGIEKKKALLKAEGAVV